ncbi:UNVERIFIED_CONTAM: hypothetical protein HDU68_005542 [Siphonaria sp. JEL0065]|nr:hypothetical protein HDU68_005542 [Siphonaria sp. JEL0065]
MQIDTSATPDPDPNDPNDSNDPNSGVVFLDSPCSFEEDELSLLAAAPVGQYFNVEQEQGEELSEQDEDDVVFLDSPCSFDEDELGLLEAAPLGSRPFDSPPASPSFFSTALGLGLGLNPNNSQTTSSADPDVEDNNDKPIAARPSFKKRILSAEDRTQNLVVKVHSANTQRERDAYFATLNDLRKEIGESKSPQILIPVGNPTSGNIMVVKHEKKEQPEFDLPMSSPQPVSSEYTPPRLNIFGYRKSSEAGVSLAPSMHREGSTSTGVDKVKEFLTKTHALGSTIGNTLTQKRSFQLSKPTIVAESSVPSPAPTQFHVMQASKIGSQPALSSSSSFALSDGAPSKSSFKVLTSVKAASSDSNISNHATVAPLSSGSPPQQKPSFGIVPQMHIFVPSPPPTRSPPPPSRLISLDAQIESSVASKNEGVILVQSPPPKRAPPPPIDQPEFGPPQPSNTIFHQNSSFSPTSTIKSFGIQSNQTKNEPFKVLRVFNTKDPSDEDQLHVVSTTKFSIVKKDDEPKRNEISLDSPPPRPTSRPPSAQDKLVNLAITPPTGTVDVLTPISEIPPSLPQPPLQLPLESQVSSEDLSKVSKPATSTSPAPPPLATTFQPPPITTLKSQTSSNVSLKSSVESLNQITEENTITTATASTLSIASSSALPKLSRKPPPAIPRAKTLNLQKKFKLAKMCIEGSEKYSSGPYEASQLREEGFKYLQELKGVFPDAQYYLGKCFAEDGNYLMAFPAFLGAAISTNTESCYAVATCFEFGKGTTVEFEKAQYFYGQAAAKGHLLAMHRLAVAFLNGELNQVVDIPRGLNWLQKCTLYPTPDPTKSLALYQFSYIYEHGIPKHINPNTEENIKVARTFLQEAAYNTHPGAITRLAAAYESGSLGLPKKINIAAELYVQAASLQDPEAMFIIAEYSLTGLIVMDCGCTVHNIFDNTNLENPLLKSAPAEDLIDTWRIPSLESASVSSTPASSPPLSAPYLSETTMNQNPTKPATKPHESSCHFTTLIPPSLEKAFSLLSQLVALPEPVVGGSLSSSATPTITPSAQIKHSETINTLPIPSHHNTITSINPSATTPQPPVPQQPAPTSTTITRIKTDAKYALAYMYEHGLFTDRDYAKAVQLYKESSAGGNVLARQRVAAIKAEELSLLVLGSNGAGERALVSGNSNTVATVAGGGGVSAAGTLRGVGGAGGLSSSNDAREAFIQYASLRSGGGGGVTAGDGGGGAANGGEEERVFGIVKSRKAKKKDHEEFERKLEVAGMLNVPVVELRGGISGGGIGGTSGGGGRVISGMPNEDRCVVM